MSRTRQNREDGERRRLLGEECEVTLKVEEERPDSKTATQTFELPSTSRCVMSLRDMSIT